LLRTVRIIIEIQMAVYSSKLVLRISWCLSGAAIPTTACRETPLSLSPSVCCEKLMDADEWQIDVTADKGFKALEVIRSQFICNSVQFKFHQCKQPSTIKFGFVVADCFTFC
jgi:hypothetical protein